MKEIRDKISQMLKTGQFTDLDEFINEMAYITRHTIDGGYWGYPCSFVLEIAKNMKEEQDGSKKG